MFTGTLQDSTLCPRACQQYFGYRGGTKWMGDFKCREVKTEFCRKSLMQTGSSLAGNLVKPLISLNGTKWRDRGYGLRRNFNWPQGRVFRVHYYNLGDGDLGFWLWGDVSLVMYSSDVPERIVTIAGTEYIFYWDETGLLRVCPISWSVHCNFTGDGNSNERGWACTPHPHQPGPILPEFYPHDWLYARKQRLLLCVLCD